MATLTGDDSNNLMVGTNASDTIIAKGGNDTLRAGGGAGTDSLFGDDGNDLLDTGVASGAVYLDGGIGNDTLLAVGPFAAGDVFYGGDGTDFLNLSKVGKLGLKLNLAGETLETGALLLSVTGIENAATGAGNDLLTGGTGDNRLVGNAGNDTIYGINGDDSLYGGADNDLLNDLLDGFWLYGGDGDDRFVTDYSADSGGLIDGGLGRDLLDLQGSGYAWKINLGSGTAKVTDNVTQKTHQVIAIEDVNGGAEADEILGNVSANRLRGFAGADTLWGQGGDDVIVADGGSYGENYQGGDGFDTLDLSRLTGTVRIYTSGSSAYAGGGFTSSGFEKVLGGGGVDILDDSASLRQLYGGAGNDSINADDKISTADFFYGGAGVDYLYLGSNMTRDMVFNMMTGELTGHGGAFGFEEVLAGLGNDQVFGNNAANFIDGNDGRDTLYGGGGADLLIGQDGSDVLDGGAGADRLEGREGADRLTGGGGADVFAFIDETDAGTGGARDVIEDYQAGVDSIAIDMFDPSMKLIGKAAFSGTAFEVRSFKSGFDMKIQIDLDGDAAADFEILVVNTNSVSILLHEV